MNRDLSISVKEARKYLGKNYKDLSDEQIEYIINALSKIAEMAISGSKSGQ